MRVMLVSPFQPHPLADHGGGYYLGHLVAAMRAHADIAVVHYRHADDVEDLPGVVKFVTDRQRRPERSPAGRLADSMRFAWRWGPLRLPLEVAKLRTPALRALLARGRHEFRPDVVLVEFSVMAWSLLDLQGVPTILTDHERAESVPRRIGPFSWTVARDRRLWPAYARRFYPLASRLQALTAPDAGQIERLVGRSVHVRSPMVAVPDTGVRPDQSGPVMLFFGDYRHHPNPETATVLAREILPLVRQRIAAAQLWLAGARPTPDVQALAGLPGVRVLGFVDDLRGTIAQSRLLIAPVYSGSGVRTKSLLGMAHGLPLVTNRLGLQGIQPPTAAVAIGESPVELAQASVDWLADPAAAAAAGRLARAYVVAGFSVERLAQEQIEACEHLLEGHRRASAE